jgi:hypothetical protein
MIGKELFVRLGVMGDGQNEIIRGVSDAQDIRS